MNRCAWGRWKALDSVGSEPFLHSRHSLPSPCKSIHSTSMATCDLELPELSEAACQGITRARSHTQAPGQRRG